MLPNDTPLVAIDVSKGKSHAQGFLCRGSPRGKPFSFDHTKTGFSKLEAAVSALRGEAGKEPTVAFEHTGVYSRVVAKWAESAGIRQIAISPLLSAKARKSKLRPTKNDSLDCKSIAEAAYGVRADARLRQQTIERLLPCITEGRNFPQDLMLSCVRRASHSIALEPWEAARTRSIACALVRGFHHRNLKEDLTMALDETCADRSYLFGRVLACAEQVEQRAAYLANSDTRRPTNALRYEAAFTQHPAKTTALLRKQLEPYLERAIKAGKEPYASILMLQVLDRIPVSDFNDKPLSELYLLGYASQRAEFFKKADSENQKED